MISLTDFLSSFFPDENEDIYFRGFKPKEAPETDKNRACKVPVSRRQLATDKSLQDRLRKLNQNRGLYFVVNAGGDKDEEITRFSAVFCEDDNRPIEEQHLKLDAGPLPSSLRIETSKSVHSYWLLNPGCTEAKWRQIQNGLLAYFGSDPKIKNPSRVMRLPFFNHVSLNGNGGLHYKRVELVQFEPTRRYSAEELLKAFPVPDEGEPAAEPSGPGSGSYRTWDELNAELARRLMADPTYQTKGEWAMAKGRCHNGQSNTAIHRNLLTGKVHCKAGCNYRDILRAYGLPEEPVDKRQSEAEEWPEPLPLRDEVTSIPDLPSEWLPESVRPWLEDTAERMDVPLSFPAAAALVGLGAAVGRRACMTTLQHDKSWRVVPTLWGAVIGQLAR